MLWQFLTFIAVIVAVIGFLVYRYYIEPPISRQMTSAKWSKGTPAFIENEVGIVNFLVTNKQLPEGVKYIKGAGWYANAVRDVTEVEDEVKRGPGRPPKNEAELTSKEEQENDELLEMITHTPILNGLGKQVFFGSTTSVALTGLKTIAHADLRKTRLLAPRMYSKTQLAALAAGNRLEGQKMRGKETTQILMLCIGVAAILGTMGLVVYLIMNGGAKPVQVAAPEAELIIGNLINLLR
jgi:hypothetical protein